MLKENAVTNIYNLIFNFDHFQSPILVWKMKLPEKKPLVRIDKPEELRRVVRRASQRRIDNPVNILLEFQSTNEQF